MCLELPPSSIPPPSFYPLSPPSSPPSHSLLFLILLLLTQYERKRQTYEEKIDASLHIWSPGQTLAFSLLSHYIYRVNLILSLAFKKNPVYNSAIGLSKQLIQTGTRPLIFFPSLPLRVRLEGFLSREEFVAATKNNRGSKEIIN